ncbi:UvrB/UvrC motif-containing protein [Zhaonella formicivorans]|uniref:UvrB/UvrC motif-containing protein n=1 Tax=Zhaonella formicivorans TaxID=2528593 RepID=UPI0010F1E58C|nr:UvrB/UvrC motif-containing protein [Zhaonella formicivorans]
MLCQECKKRPATVHITKIINNDKTQISLCEECASAYHQQLSSAFEPNFSINKFLAGLLNYDHGIEAGAKTVRNVCPQCGQSYAYFSQTGKLGCDRCYETFEESLVPLLRRVHGTQVHKGKVPKRTGGSIRLRKELQDLKSKLQELIRREEFEEAAKVRDRIRELEKQIEK